MCTVQLQLSSVIDLQEPFRFTQSCCHYLVYLMSRTLGYQCVGCSRTLSGGHIFYKASVQPAGEMDSLKSNVGKRYR